MTRRISLGLLLFSLTLPDRAAATCPNIVDEQLSLQLEEVTVDGRPVTPSVVGAAEGLIVGYAPAYADPTLPLAAWQNFDERWRYCDAP